MKKNDSFFNKMESEDFPKWPFLINGREDVVFIHIPKTAGTSIRWSLDFNKSDKTASLRKHTKASDIIALMGLENWSKAFKFTFVRNPWDRLLSFYHYRVQNNKIIKDVARQKSFREWAFFKLTERGRASFNASNLKPQTHWLRDQQGNIDLDFIGRFENLDQDYNILKKHLNANSTLQHLNKNALDLDYRQHYDSELQLLVAHYYEEDIDFFGYTF